MREVPLLAWRHLAVPLPELTVGAAGVARFFVGSGFVMVHASRALFGSPVAGFAYDFFGSYSGTILAGAALCFVSFAITMLAPEPARWLAMQKASP